MKIAIIGTRGIPNQYGGFEQFAEQFSVRMAERGHDVSVYCSHRHPFKSDVFKGVTLIHCFDPEFIFGTFGQFIYDFNCILDSRKQNFDIIFQLGYTSSTIWSWLYPSSAILATNMDGLEWKRTKYNPITRRFLRSAEKWAIKYSDFLVADSLGIQEYLGNKFNASSFFIPYGADNFIPESDDVQMLDKYSLRPYNYDLLIARFEPENNIEIALKAYRNYKNRKLVLIGNYSATRFGKKMCEEYQKYPNIIFLGAVFESHTLNILRYYSLLYIHGHSVGGTNPSLLEAMACSALICANDNVFNKAVLGSDAFYFDSDKDLRSLIDLDPSKKDYGTFISNNKQKIGNEYNWNIITDKTEELFKQWQQ